MSEPFLAEIHIMGFNFAPRGYAMCDGQILPINQNQALYSLLGTTYGGDGRTSFGLPDLRGRVPVHVGLPPGGGETVSHGEKSGAESHVLDVNQMPQHTHAVSASGDQASASSIAGNALSSQARRGVAMYNNTGERTQLHGSTVTQAGSGQAHNNMQPYLALNFVIAIQGLFPSRN